MKFYVIEEDASPPYTGDIDAIHKWSLPGSQGCPTCGAGGGVGGLGYPCVDLSGLPAGELRKLSDPWPVPWEEFVRLRELVRPLAPSWASLKPGAGLGPLTGKGSGRFGQLAAYLSTFLLLQRDALEQLQAEGMRGLHCCPIDVRFRGKNAPELLEAQLELAGHLHPDCLPLDRKPPCPTCGNEPFKRPGTPVLAAASLPGQLDVFRLNQNLAIIATERFVDTVRRLDLGGVKFRELEAR